MLHFSEYINSVDRKRVGRPNKSDEDRLDIPVVVRLNQELRDKLTRLGGPQWLRERIKKAREPDKQE